MKQLETVFLRTVLHWLKAVNMKIEDSGFLASLSFKDKEHETVLGCCLYLQMFLEIFAIQILKSIKLRNKHTALIIIFIEYLIPKTKLKFLCVIDYSYGVTFFNKCFLLTQVFLVSNSPLNSEFSPLLRNICLLKCSWKVFYHCNGKKYIVILTSWIWILTFFQNLLPSFCCSEKEMLWKLISACFMSIHKMGLSLSEIKH